MKRFPLILAAFLLLNLPAGPCWSSESKNTDVPEKLDHILEFRYQEGGVITSIGIEIADRADTRARGLMERTELKCSQGMLFVFDQTQRLSFWMRNTPIPLDMFFVDAQGLIFHIVHQAHPMSDTIYSPPQPGRYVVETCAGFARRHEIVPGMRIEWHRQP